MHTPSLSFRKVEFENSYSPNVSFSSPIHIADFGEQVKAESPQCDEKEQIERMQRRMLEREQFQEQLFFDVTGKRIHSFVQIDFHEEAALPIVEDKENYLHVHHVKTPMKIKQQRRSPLQDITPLATSTIRKNRLWVSEKNKFLTPRTMDKENKGSGIRRIL